MLCEDVINKSIDSMLEKHGNRDESAEKYLGHIKAMAKPEEGVEKILLDAVNFLASYADIYFRTYDKYISQDEVYGKCWYNILTNIRGIIFGGTGRLDGKTLDNLLVDMAESQKFDISS